jgi:hypothetical protein
MSQIGNVVALHQRQPAGLPKAPVRVRVDVSPLSALERTFCSVSLNAMVVTHGVMHGETLETCADFMPGDTFRLNDGEGMFAANDHTHAPKPGNATRPDCATIRRLAEWAEVLRIVLLDETGCSHLGYAVEPRFKGMRAPYVLLPRDLPSQRKLTLIEAVEV